MSETDLTAAQVTKTYYDILRAGNDCFDRARLRAVLAPDLIFEGPIAGRRAGAEPFLAGVARFVTVMRSFEMLELLATGNRAAALYDAELPGGPVRFAEFFETGNGAITSLRLLYDASEYRNRGGR